MGWKKVTIGLVGLGVLLLWLGYCWWTTEVVVIGFPTTLHSDYPTGGSPDHKTALRELQPGEIGTVIHVRYGKDRMYYKIRLPDGQKGYVEDGCCWVGPKRELRRAGRPR